MVRFQNHEVVIGVALLAVLMIVSMRLTARSQ